MSPEVNVVGSCVGLNMGDGGVNEDSAMRADEDGGRPWSWAAICTILCWRVGK
jgi:hypothetical protein